MLRSDLVAALTKRRDNYVHVDVGGMSVPVGGVDYDTRDNRVKIRLDPVGLSDVLDMFAEDAVARVIAWRMHIQPRFAAMITSGERPWRYEPTAPGDATSPKAT